MEDHKRLFEAEHAGIQIQSQDDVLEWIEWEVVRVRGVLECFGDGLAHGVGSTQVSFKLGDLVSMVDLLSGRLALVSEALKMALERERSRGRVG